MGSYPKACNLLGEADYLSPKQTSYQGIVSPFFSSKPEGLNAAWVGQAIKEV